MLRSQALPAWRDMPRGPVRRVVPSMSSSLVEYRMGGATFACASLEKVASTHPVPSSTEVKTTRLPPRIGGVWVATRPVTDNEPEPLAPDPVPLFVTGRFAADWLALLGVFGL